MPSTATHTPAPSVKAEALFSLFGIPFTNSMLMTLIVMAVILLFFVLALRQRATVPGRAQNLAETIIELVLGLVEGTAGKRTGRVIFPLIATLFIFVLCANWFSLIPGVSSILITPAANVAEHVTTLTDGATEIEKVPLLHAPNADLNTTAAMALIAVIVVQAAGVIAHGVGGYLKELSTPIFLTPIHVVGELSRILSLSCRLFGNVFGGEVLLLVMFYLFSGVFVGFLGFIFVGLEVFFGLIQALLFAILTLNYIAVAVGGHGDEHGASHGDDAVAGADELAHSEYSGTMAHMA